MQGELFPDYDLDMLSDCVLGGSMHQVDGRREAFSVLTALNFVVSRPNGRRGKGILRLEVNCFRERDL